MATIELHFKDNSVQLIPLALDDLIATTKIATSIRKAINLENANQCIFTKVY